MKKLLLALCAIGLFALGSVAVAQNARTSGNWIGTTHIFSGDIIRSAPLKSNIEWLFANKVVKPLDCNSDSSRLAWSGGWQCEPNITDEVVPGRSCLFDGTTIPDGSSVSAFSTESVDFGERCVSEVRSCTDGSLSGSYSFRDCGPREPESCTFAGSIVQHGNEVRAYETATVPFGQECASEIRSCSNGSLSGSNEFRTCAPVAAGFCTFNGASVPHGETVTAFREASVDAPATCAPETRECTNGVLSGSYTQSNCDVVAAACSSQDLTFNYNVRIYGQGIDEQGNDCIVQQSPNPPGYVGNCRPVDGGTLTPLSCTIPSSLVPSSVPGETETYIPSQCSASQPLAPSGIAYNASCGLSGWELSTSVINLGTCTPTDAGKVVEVRNFAPTAEILQVDNRCSCGVSIVGGQYGANVTCTGKGTGLGL